MRRLTRFFDRAGEAIGEHHKLARGFPACHRLEHHIVPALRQRCAVPGAMKGYKGAAPVRPRKLFRIVEGKIVRRPMRRERSNRFPFLRAEPNLLAVAAIFGSEDELVQRRVEITIGPAIIGALLELNEFFGGSWAFCCRLKNLGQLWPS